MKVSLNEIERRLEKAEKYQSPKIMKETLKELQQIYEEKLKEWDSQESEAEREAKYQEILRVGELRKQAFMRGESMDQYPVPWETPEALERQIREEKEWIETFRECGLDTEHNENSLRALEEKLEKARSRENAT